MAAAVAAATTLVEIGPVAVAPVAVALVPPEPAVVVALVPEQAAAAIADLVGFVRSVEGLPHDWDHASFLGDSEAELQADSVGAFVVAEEQQLSAPLQRSTVVVVVVVVPARVTIVQPEKCQPLVLSAAVLDRPMPLSG